MLPMNGHRVFYCCTGQQPRLERCGHLWSVFDLLSWQQVCCGHYWIGFNPCNGKWYHYNRRVWPNTSLTCISCYLVCHCQQIFYPHIKLPKSVLKKMVYFNNSNAKILSYHLQNTGSFDKIVMKLWLQT